jgi:hypothetical protein
MEKPVDARFEAADGVPKLLKQLEPLWLLIGRPNPIDDAYDHILNNASLIYQEAQTQSQSRGSRRVSMPDLCRH